MTSPVPIRRSASDFRSLVDGELELITIATVWTGGISEYEAVRDALVDAFATEVGRHLWTATTAAALSGRIGVDTVAHVLRESGDLDRVGGLSGLMDAHGRALGDKAAGFAESLQAMAKRRRAKTALSKMDRALSSGDLPTESDIEALRETIRQQPSGALQVEWLPAVGAVEELPTYICEPLLPVGAVVALTGDSGSGKSTLATGLIRDAITTGHPALILDRENPRSVALDRMRRLGLSDSALLRWWGGWMDGGVPGLDAPQITAWAARNEQPIVVADSVVAFLEGDENSASEMRAFLNQARRLADRGACVVLIHHDGKSESARDYRGSSDFKAGLDAAFHVANISSDARLDRLRLRCFKSRYGFVGDLSYRYADGRMIRDEREATPAATTADQLTALLRQNPGVTQRRYEDLAHRAGVSRQRARQFVEDGVLAGRIDRKPGAKNTKSIHLIGGQDDGL